MISLQLIVGEKFNCWMQALLFIFASINVLTKSWEQKLIIIPTFIFLGWRCHDQWL